VNFTCSIHLHENSHNHTQLRHDHIPSIGTNANFLNHIPFWQTISTLCTANFALLHCSTAAS
jgi:hypothetical protein